MGMMEFARRHAREGVVLFGLANLACPQLSSQMETDISGEFERILRDPCFSTGGSTGGDSDSTAASRDDLREDRDQVKHWRLMGQRGEQEVTEKFFTLTASGLGEEREYKIRISSMEESWRGDGEFCWFHERYTFNTDGFLTDASKAETDNGIESETPLAVNGQLQMTAISRVMTSVARWRGGAGECQTK